MMLLEHVINLIVAIGLTVMGLKLEQLFVETNQVAYIVISAPLFLAGVLVLIIYLVALLQHRQKTMEDGNR